MAFGIHKGENTVCTRCAGPIVKGITKVRWAPTGKDAGKPSHAECYYEQGASKQRGGNNRFLDGTGEEIPGGELPAIDLKAPKMSGEQGNGQSNGAGGQGEPDEEQQDQDEQDKKDSKSESKDDDLVEMIAKRVTPKVKAMLDSKVDAKQVEAIAKTEVQKEVKNVAEKLREEFTTKITINDVKTGEIKELEGLQHKQFVKLLALAQSRLNIYLFDAKNGGPGSGKTSASEQVAKALGLKFHHISLNIQSQPSLILGYKTAHGDFVSTPFRDWYENGGVFLFDEMDNANGNFMTSLNTALANNTCAFPDGVVSRHVDAICIGAGNTTGMGASGMHSSRQVLDAATRERFVFLGWEYDEKLERKIALAIHAKSEPWIAYIQSVRKTVAKLGVKMIASPRASIYGAEMMRKQPGVFTPEEMADLSMFKGIDADTRSKIVANNPFPVC